MELSLKDFIIILLVISISMSSFTVAGTSVENQISIVSSPSNLSGIVHRGHIALEWDPPSTGVGNITGYFVYRGLGSSTLEGLEKVDGTNYLDESIESGRTYTYHVTAIYDGEKESSPSNSIEIKARGSNTPTVPLEISTHPGNSRAIIDWEEPVDDGGKEIEGYNIYRGEDPTNIKIEQESIHRTFFEDSDVNNGIEYFYVVTATNYEGESDWSEVVTTKPSENITKPTQPYDLQAFSGTECIELYWRGPKEMGNSTLFEYRIYRKSGSFYEHVGSTKKTYYQDIDANIGVYYEYVVTAVNGQGESNRSNLVESISVLNNTPKPPYNISAESTEDLIRLNWYDEEDISSCLIFRGESPNDLEYYDEVKSTSYFEDTDIQENVTYHYSLKSVDDVGRISSFSETIEITSLEEKPDDDDPISSTTYVLSGLIIGLITLSLLLYFHKDKIISLTKNEKIRWDEESNESNTERDEVVVKPKDIREIDSVECEDDFSETGQIEIKKRDDLIKD